MSEHVPPQVPDAVMPFFESHGVKFESIVFGTFTDLSKEHIRCDVYAVLTDEKLCVLTGNVSLEPVGRKSIFKKRCLGEKFTEIDYIEYRLCDFKSYDIDESTSGASLVGELCDGSFKVLLCSTNTAKDSLSELRGLLTHKDDDEHETHGEPHGNGGHHGHGGPHGPGGGPPSGGPGGGKSSLYCPKCGKKYSDPQRKICLECMDKGKIIRRLFSFIVKYRFQMFASVAILILTSALSIISPYISSGFYYDQVLNEAGEFYGQLLLVLFLIVGTRLLSMGVTVLSNLVNARISANLQYDLKNVIFSSIEKLSLKYFSDKQTGALMTQVTGDATTIYWFFQDGLPYYLINGVQILAVVVIMFTMNPLLAGLYLLSVPFIFLFIKRLFGSMGKYHGKRFTESRRLNAQLSDTFTGMRVIKAFSKEKDGSRRFEIVNSRASEANRITSRYGTLNFPLVDVLMMVSQLIVMGVGGYLVVNGDLQYGTLMTFIAYMGMVYGPMYQFAHMSYEATDSLNAMNRLIEIMDADTELKESECPVVKEVLRGDVEFSHVDFGYNKSHLALKDLSFRVPAGTILGVVGHTGAGKSTLANLLLRLYDTDRGDVKLDGVSVRELSSESIRRNVAIVSQETYLFVGTIMDNIRYAKPEATVEEVIRAAKISGAHDFIVKLPDAYSTLIGFGKRGLSGGECQRLSIARAILQNPSILILDEATASMDTQTERKIQSALDILVQGKTTIMIAHRLSTLRNADTLIVLKDGEICERGTHEELLRAKGEYYKLYSLQLAALKNVGVEA